MDITICGVFTGSIPNLVRISSPVLFRFFGLVYFNVEAVTKDSLIIKCASVKKTEVSGFWYHISGFWMYLMN